LKSLRLVVLLALVPGLVDVAPVRAAESRHEIAITIKFWARWIHKAGYPCRAVYGARFEPAGNGEDEHMRMDCGDTFAPDGGKARLIYHIYPQRFGDWHVRRMPDRVF
jgi:hypothetical protein